MRFGTFSEVFGADSKDGDTYNMKIIQTVMVCIATAVCSGASVYHVDAVGGDDSRDGLTEDTAWRSLARVNAADVKPGDSVLFKRGCVWRGMPTTICGHCRRRIG